MTKSRTLFVLCALAAAAGLAYSVARMARPTPETVTETGPCGRLTIGAPDGSTRSIPAIPGTAVRIGAEEYRVTGCGPWVGLYPGQGTGRPMAHALLRDAGAWSEDLFIADEEWQQVNPDAALHFAWVSSEDEALRLAQTPPADATRWGVRDADGVNWFNSFVPGTGANLAGGQSVTLIEHDPAHRFPNGVRAAIRVAIDTVIGRAECWVPCNEDAPKALVRFENPAAMDAVFVLYAWTWDKALAVYRERGEFRASTVMEAGTAWTPETSNVALRLVTALDDAVPVLPGKGTLQGVALESSTTMLRLRQGEVRRIGATSVRFIVNPHPPSPSGRGARGPLKRAVFSSLPHVTSIGEE